MTQWGTVFKSLGGILVLALIASIYTFGQTRPAPIDPGVRGGPAGGGTPLNGLTADETAFFQDGQARFADIEVVIGGANNGLGPRFNSNQCFSCHSQPSEGGTSPAQNPLIAVATLNGAKNIVPWFITQNGPVREARFKKSNGNADGEVHVEEEDALSDAPERSGSELVRAGATLRDAVGESFAHVMDDGRTTNLVQAIRDHQSLGSEANKVVEHFNRLTTQEQQELIDFLRSL